MLQHYLLVPRAASSSVLQYARHMDDAERAEAFYAHVGSGGKVEADDWMPDDYRAALLKFVEMHANSELMGVLPEREWILRAPTLRRKLALTAKVQDEVGHAQLLYRVAEDLGKPREAMLADLLAGKTKFHNVFHYPTRSWADVGPAPGRVVEHVVELGLAGEQVGQHRLARLAEVLGDPVQQLRVADLVLHLGGQGELPPEGRGAQNPLALG